MEDTHLADDAALEADIMADDALMETLDPAEAAAIPPAAAAALELAIMVAVPAAEVTLMRLPVSFADPREALRAHAEDAMPLVLEDPAAVRHSALEPGSTLIISRPTEVKEDTHEQSPLGCS